MSEREARNQRRERRFGYRGDTILEAGRDELHTRILRLRDEERLARKRHDDADADRYRIAANACEDALAEIESVIPDVRKDD